MKKDLKDLISENFSVWTDGINEKSALLTHLYADEQNVDEGETFYDFLNRIRAEYDA